MDNSNNKPLSVLMEEARARITIAVNQAMAMSHLPAYLCEGILLGILADVRNSKNLEVISDIYNQNIEESKEGENNSGDNKGDQT